MRSPVKTKAISGVLLLLMSIQCFPGNAWGYDVHTFIKNFVSSQVERSDEIINKNKLKIKTSVNKAAEGYENIWLGGISFLENKTALNEQSKPFKALKDYNLFNLGFNSGVIKGAGDLTAELYSFAAKIPTAPERIAKFGYNYAEDPKKYRNMVTNGAKTVVGVVSNPVPLYQHGKNAYFEAAKDPLKFGNLHGEAVVFLGSAFVGGGQVKALSTAPKIKKATQFSKVKTSLGLALDLKKTEAKRGNFGFLAYSADDAVGDFEKILSNINAGKVATMHMDIRDLELKVTGLLERVDRTLPKKFTLDDLDDAVIKGTPIPMTREAVDLVANMAGIGIDGVKVDINKFDSLIKSSLLGIATKNNIGLYPGAFKNFQSLVTTLGHERIHVLQHRLYNVDSPQKLNMYRAVFEKAAYGTEGQWLDYFSINYQKYLQQKYKQAIRELKAEIDT